MEFKTRVAPVKRLTLPHLEILGTLLAAYLRSEIKKIIDHKNIFKPIIEDSKIALFWI